MNVGQALALSPIAGLIGLILLLVYLDRRFGPPNGGDAKRNLRQCEPLNQAPDKLKLVTSLLRAFLLAILRGTLVVSIAAPVLLLQMQSGILFFGYHPIALVLNCTAALCGLAWACLPLVRVSLFGGVIFGAGWGALAIHHIGETYWRPAGLSVLLSWFLATSLLAAWLVTHPPKYVLKRWLRQPKVDEAAKIGIGE